MTALSNARIGSTLGLERYSDDRPNEAEQVYVDALEGRESRTIAIRRARGYAWPVVLELTDRQASDLAKILLAHVGGDAYAPPRDVRMAGRLREDARRLRELADQLDGGA